MLHFQICFSVLVRKLFRLQIYSRIREDTINKSVVIVYKIRQPFIFFIKSDDERLKFTFCSQMLDYCLEQ